MGNSSSRKDGQISRLEDALKQSSVVQQKLRKHIQAHVVVAALAGGGTLLLVYIYIIKERFFPSEASFLLPDPWRTIHATEKDISKIKDFYLGKIVDTCNDQDTKLNILLLGQAASGKSSFINSCKTCLRQTGTIDGKVQLPVRLLDCRGLLDENRGVQTEDIINICDGHVKDEYEIQPETPLSSDNPKFSANPGEKEKIHCVVYVIDAQNGDNFVRERVKEQFEEVKNHLLKSPISTPQLILLTKVDQLGARQMHKIFYDKRVEKCCEKVSSFFGFPLGNVLPQANYSKEATPTEEKDCITLFNIWTIMERANDYAQSISDKTERVPK